MGFQIDSTPNTFVVICLGCLLRPGVSAWQALAFTRGGAWDAAARHETTAHPLDYTARDAARQHHKRHPGD